MFGIGFGEMLVIGVVLLLAVGPKQLPQLMKTVGKGMRDVRRAAEDLRRSTGIDELLRDEDLRNPLRKDPPRFKMGATDLERESPREGLDSREAAAQAELTARAAQQAAAKNAADQAHATVELPPSEKQRTGAVDG